MTISRALAQVSSSLTSPQGAGNRLLEQAVIDTNTTAGSATLLVQSLVRGILRRTGPAAGFNDTFPSADALLQAEPDLSVGDSFYFTYINGVAQAMTAVAGEGVVLGSNVNVAASAIRKYLISILGTGPRQVFQGNVTNGSAVISGVSAAILANVSNGQGVTGTNIPANTFVIGVNPVAGTITMSANATGTATVSVTSFPRYSVEGLFAATA